MPMSTCMDTSIMQPSVVPNKVFVGGIPSSASKQQLLKAAQVFGKVKSVKLIKNLTNSTATFGFVSFWQEEDAQRMIAGEVNLRGKVLDCKPTTKYDALKQTNEQLLRRKVYIGGFCKSLSEADIQDLFRPFGGVEQVVINRDLDSGKSRGSGFVMFNSESVCQKVVSYGITALGHLRMIVLPCQRRGLINKALTTNTKKSSPKHRTLSDPKIEAKKTKAFHKVSSFGQTDPCQSNDGLQNSSESNWLACRVSTTACQHKKQVDLNHFAENLLFNQHSQKMSKSRLVDRRLVVPEFFQDTQESSQSLKQNSSRSG